MKNEVSNDFQEINGKTIDYIFLELCASQEVAIKHIVPSSLASPSDDELPLSSLLPRGFKMKKGVKSEKNETKNRCITRFRKTKTKVYCIGYHVTASSHSLFALQAFAPECH